MATKNKLIMRSFPTEIPAVGFYFDGWSAYTVIARRDERKALKWNDYTGFWQPQTYIKSIPEDALLPYSEFMDIVLEKCKLP